MAEADPRARSAPRLSRVICTLDESESIAAVLHEAMHAMAGLGCEIVVVDDSSDDRTAASVLSVAATQPDIRLIRRRGKRGLASAAIAGFDAARGPILALMDGDGQHDPRVIPLLLAGMEAAHSDMAVASRYVVDAPSGLTGLRHAISRSGTRLTQTLLGMPTTDPLSGLFMVRRTWFESARPHLSGVGFKILVDLISSGPRRPKIVEARTALRPRHGGESKLDLRVVAELGAVLIEKRSAGMVSARFALFAGVGSTGVAIHLAALVLVGWAGGLAFWAAQAVAILVAMTWNFHLNNALTFRDLKLRGRARLQGLFKFYLACAGGAALSEAVAATMFWVGAPSIAAGLGGAVAAALWNYWSVKRETWGATEATATTAEISAARVPAGVPARIPAVAPARQAPDRLPEPRRLAG